MKTHGEGFGLSGIPISKALARKQVAASGGTRSQYVSLGSHRGEVWDSLLTPTFHENLVSPAQGLALSDMNGQCGKFTTLDVMVQ